MGTSRSSLLTTSLKVTRLKKLSQKYRLSKIANKIDDEKKKKKSYKNRSVVGRKNKRKNVYENNSKLTRMNDVEMIN